MKLILVIAKVIFIIALCLATIPWLIPVIQGESSYDANLGFFFIAFVLSGLITLCQFGINKIKAKAAKQSIL
jgi:uncharacterized membrane protein